MLGDDFAKKPITENELAHMIAAVAIAELRNTPPGDPVGMSQALQYLAEKKEIKTLNDLTLELTELGSTTRLKGRYMSYSEMHEHGAWGSTPAAPPPAAAAAAAPGAKSGNRAATAAGGAHDGRQRSGGGSNTPNAPRMEHGRMSKTQLDDIAAALKTSLPALRLENTMVTLETNMTNPKQKGAAFAFTTSVKGYPGAGLLRSTNAQDKTLTMEVGMRLIGTLTVRIADDGTALGFRLTDFALAPRGAGAVRQQQQTSEPGSKGPPRRQPSWRHFWRQFGVHKIHNDGGCRAQTC
jgi:hypothetical protein